MSAAGAAMAKKFNKDPFLVFSRMAMVNWMKDKTGKRSCFASIHHKIDNLIATIDWNGQQIDGPTREVMGLGDPACQV